MGKRSHAAIAHSSLVAEPDNWSAAAQSDSSLAAKVVLNLCNSISVQALPAWFRWKVRKPRNPLFRRRSISRRAAPPPPPPPRPHHHALIKSNCTAAGSKAISAAKIVATSSNRLKKKTVSLVIGNLKKPQPSDAAVKIKFKLADRRTPVDRRTPDRRTSGRQPKNLLKI